MGSGTWGRFLKGVLFGAACGVATFAIAVVSGYSLAQVQLTSAGKPAPATPTAEQMQRALERLTAPSSLPLGTPADVDWGVGTTYPTPAATAEPGATPSGTPAASSGAPGTSSTLRGSAPTPAVATLGQDEVTPQPTAQAGNAAVPTRTPFTPPTIIPIQPLGTPTGR